MLQQGGERGGLCVMLLLVMCVVTHAIHPPRYMISSLHGIQMKTKTESQLLKEGDGIACCKEIREVRNASGTHYSVTKMSVSDFAKEINDLAKQKGENASVLFYIPDKDLNIKDVFRHCNKLENSIGPNGNATIVVPCVYTNPWDAAHFTPNRLANKIADNYYAEPSKATLKKTVSHLTRSIHAPMNVFAHGFGARLLSRFDELKMDLDRKRPIFSHLFLAAPELESNFFSKQDKGKGKDATSALQTIGSNPDAGAAVAKAFKKICVLFDPADHVLRDSAADTVIETDSPVVPTFLGTKGLPTDTKQLCEKDDKFDQLNCYPASIFYDPWKRHNYFQSDYALGWVNSQLGYYPQIDLNMSPRSLFDLANDGP